MLYGDPHYKDKTVYYENKTVSWWSYLYDGNPYIWKDGFILKQGHVCSRNSCVDKGQLFCKRVVSYALNLWWWKEQMALSCLWSMVNTLRQRQNGRHFADIFKCIFLNENIWILIIISMKFVSKGAINNIPALVQIMAWRRPGDKPLSESMMLSLPTHICVTRPQWVNLFPSKNYEIIGLWSITQLFASEA